MIETHQAYQRRNYASITAVCTGTDYVRYSCGHKAWYRAVLYRTDRLRVSRRSFALAGSAERYAKEVRRRFEYWHLHA